MRVVINHLTRMQRGFICVAGVDLERMVHIRPVLRGTRIPSSMLSRYGGMFDIANIIELGQVNYCGQAPQTEDYVFLPGNISQVGVADPNKFWMLLCRLAKFELRDIFGNVLLARGQSSCGVTPGMGACSLGLLHPRSRPQILINPRDGKPDQIRMIISDTDFQLNLSVTDIRLFGDDHITPNSPIINNISKRIESGVEVILSVGLTRKFPPNNPVHWLQINNIHLADDPRWQLN